MCDQLDGRGCEVVDELYLEITNLEMTIADLKKDIVYDLEEIRDYVHANKTYSQDIIPYIQKWEAK